jgi:hypothetical protein
MPEEFVIKKILNNLGSAEQIMIMIILNRLRVLKHLLILKHLDEIVSADRGYVFETSC